MWNSVSKHVVGAFEGAAPRCPAAEQLPGPILVKGGVVHAGAGLEPPRKDYGVGCYRRR